MSITTCRLSRSARLPLLKYFVGDTDLNTDATKGLAGAEDLAQEVNVGDETYEASILTECATHGNGSVGGRGRHLPVSYLMGNGLNFQTLGGDNRLVKVQTFFLKIAPILF